MTERYMRQFYMLKSFKWRSLEKHLGLTMLAVAVPVGILALNTLDSPNETIKAFSRAFSCAGIAILASLPVCRLVIDKSAEERFEARKPQTFYVRTPQGIKPIQIQRHIED